jgi:hypothetical protein
MLSCGAGQDSLDSAPKTSPLCTGATERVRCFWSELAWMGSAGKADRPLKNCYACLTIGREVSTTTDSGNSAWRNSRYRLIRPSTTSKKLNTEPRMGLPVGGRPSQVPAWRPVKDHQAMTESSPATMRSTVTSRPPTLRRKPLTWATKPARPGGPPNAWFASSTMSSLARSSISSSRPCATTSSRYECINVSGFTSVTPDGWQSAPMQASTRHCGPLAPAGAGPGT